MVTQKSTLLHGSGTQEEEGSGVKKGPGATVCQFDPIFAADLCSKKSKAEYMSLP